MPSTPFKPARIFVDQSVQDLLGTSRILKKFSKTPVEVIDNPKSLKHPTDMTWAKKGLLLTRMKADPIKEFSAMTRSIGGSRGQGEASLAPTKYYSLDLISNCHLECTYCILQNYLENNPIITIYTNLDEILERLDAQIRQLPDGSVIGTGRIADSLALDSICEHNRYLVLFFGRFAARARQASPLLELKTKSNQIETLLGLDHRGKTVVSWSLNPPEIIEREEFKTASFEERIVAARRVSEAGYPVGFHFDPMILHDKWQKNYSETVEGLFKEIPEEKIAWVSLGTIRYPARQKRIMTERFPKNRSIHEGLISTDRTHLHYPDNLRNEMQSFLEERLFLHLPREKVYRCMDF